MTTDEVEARACAEGGCSVGARPIYESVPGAPWQPGDLVRVVAVVDTTTSPEHIGKAGRVKYLEYSCGSGQSFPGDPMIGVELAGGTTEEFWREELAQEGATS